MADAAIQPKTYYRVAAALMGLLALTMLADALPLGALHFPVAMGIVSAKMLLVVLFFMHVKTGSRLVRVFAGAGLFWVLILFALTLADYLARGNWPPPPLGP